MLEIENLSTGYGQLEVLHGIDLSVPAGGVVALIGANAAGKTTTVNTVSGILPVWDGRISFDGEDISRLSSHRRVERGLVLVPQGRQLFGHMTIGENLELGAFTKRASSRARTTKSEVLDLFPVLAQRLQQEAGTLSGGEQSMLAIARGLMARPKLLMLDEPTEGLSPLLVGQTMRIVTDICQTGVTTLLIEQNVVQALRCATTGYVLESGRIVMQDESSALLKNTQLRAAFLGR